MPIKRIQAKGVGVLGLAINNNHEFLITCRNQPQDPAVHMKWQIPGGGSEFGEQPEETLVREMQEELNVIPTILHPLPFAKTSLLIHSKGEYCITLLCYLITIGSQIPRIGDPETLEYKWVKQSDLYGLQNLPLTVEFIDEATKMCNQYSLWPV
jgi:8-oxo-dGTP diphosphatase